VLQSRFDGHASQPSTLCDLVRAAHQRERPVQLCGCAQMTSANSDTGLPTPAQEHDVHGTGQRVLPLLGSIVFAIFLLWSVGYVPPDMDVFNQAHRLACLYQHAHLHELLEGCHNYRIDVGPLSYHRAYRYVGVTSSVLNFPFWWAWRSPLSYFVAGLLFLVGFSVMIVRAFRLESRYLLIPLCYFPISYSFIHDTGPVRLALLSFPLILLLLRGVFEAPRQTRRLLCASGAAFLMAISVEDKTFYLLLLPTLTFFAAAWRVQAISIGGLAADLARTRLPIVFGASLFALLVGTLLFVGTTEGQTYWDYLSTATERHPVRRVAKRLVAFMLAFPMYAERVFEIPRVLLLSSSVFTLGCAAWLLSSALREKSIRQRSLSLWGWSLIAGTLVFLTTRAPFNSHHFVFLHLPVLAVILLVARSSNRRFVVALTLVLVLNISAMAILGASRIRPPAARERSDVFRYLSQPDIASNNVINFSSWGAYYQQALYGHDSQLVTFAYHNGPWGEISAEKLPRLARSTSRNIINVCMDCDIDTMRDWLGTEDVAEIDLGLHLWKVFEIRPVSRAVVE
jgi:hypothetical protein